MFYCVGIVSVLAGNQNRRSRCKTGPEAYAAPITRGLRTLREPISAAAEPNRSKNVLPESGVLATAVN
jgi:hypothetical protein